MKVSYLYLVSLFSLLFISSCNKTSDRKELDKAFDTEFRSHQNSFAPFISAFTDGRIYADSRIRVELMSKYEEKPGTIIDEDLFSFKPQISGTAVWVDNYTIEFTPSEKLKLGVLYEGTFHLGKIDANVDSKHKEFPMKFYVQKQYLKVKVDKVDVNAAKEDSSYCNILGTVTLANPVELSDIKSAVTVKIGGKEEKEIEWETISDTEFKYSVKNIKLTDDSNYAIVSWNGKQIESDDKGNRRVEIPAKNSFTITGYNVNQEDGEIEIYFSDDLKSLGNYVKANVTSTFEISGNTLIVIPSSFDDDGEVEITIKEGLKSSRGLKLQKTEVIVGSILYVKPALEILGKGNIAPQSSGIIVPFKARGLYSVDVRVIRIFSNNTAQFFQNYSYLGDNNNDYDDYYYDSGDRDIAKVGKLVSRRTVSLNVDNEEIRDWKMFKFDMSDFVDLKKGEIYRVILSFRKDLTPYGNSRTGGTKSIGNNSEMERYWTSFNYYYPPYDEWGDNDEPQNDSYYNYNKWSSRDFMASDIAIVAKKGSEDKYVVQCLDILGVEPMSGVKVSLLSYQQQEIANGTTDNLGFVELKYADDETPFLLVANKGESTSYLKVQDADSKSVSNFDVSGEKLVNGLKAFIYGERDVWRPGDTIYLNVMLEDKNDLVPYNHPVVMTLTNPDGVEVNKKTLRFKGTNIYEFPCVTSSSAQTGRWNVSVSVGNSLFSKSIKIETIKPNKIKAVINVEDKQIYTPHRVEDLTLKANWLHGSPASDLNANVEVTLRDVRTTFEGFGEYNFDDKHRRVSFRSFTLFDGELSSEGVGNLSFDEDDLEDIDVSGFLNMQFVTKVYEQGGDFSIASQSCKFSPYDEFVGINIPKENSSRTYFETDKDYQFNIKTVDENGEPISVDDIEVKMYRLSWSWWWESRYNDFATFNHSSYRISKNLGDVETNSSGDGQIDINIDKKDWGYYMIKVTLPNGNTCSDVAYFDCPASYGRRVAEGNGATDLFFGAKEDSYKVGDVVEMEIPTTESGNLLVSVENGVGVINHFTQSCEKGSTKIEFKATAEMVPNIYVSVLAVQPHQKTVNDLPIRMFGIANVNISNPNSHLEPVIDLGGKSKFASSDEVSIKISEKNKQKMYYSLSIVDEGLLSITNFRTPKPWAQFNKKVALGVKTWDLYDNIFGAMAGEYAMISPAGGGDFIDYKSMQDINAKRYVPVIKNFGVFELGAGKTNKFTFKVPNYNGELRVQVVAISEEQAYGSSEKSMIIRNPITLYATLPRVLRPNEKAKMPVTLFCDDGISNVSLSVSSSGPVKFASSTQNVKVTPNEDNIVYFDLETLSKVGTASVEVVATSGSKKSVYNINLGVFPSSDEITVSSKFVLEAGKSVTKNVSNIGMEGSNKNSIEFSILPPINISKRLAYLVGYPHGCAEQKSSKLFSQLYLDRLVELTPQQRQDISYNINEGIRLLYQHQKSDGCFGYWSSRGFVNMWATSYVGNFLLEAKRLGYNVSQSVINNWISAQTRMAKSPESYSGYNSSYGNLMQAYRLYTLALAGKPVTSAMNILKDKNLDVTSTYLLAAAYALTGEKSVGRELAKGRGTETRSRSKYGYDNSTFGSRLRDDAIIMEAMLILGYEDDALILAENISKSLSTRHWYSTQTTAFCFKAFGNIASEVIGDGKLKLNIDADKTDVSINSSSPAFLQELREGDTNVKIENKGEGNVYAYIVQKGVPINPITESSNSKVEMSVSYYDKDGNTLDISRLKLGQTVVAQVTLRNPTSFRMEYLAVSQVFPSGLEIINKRILSDASGSKSGDFYQDIRDDRVYSYFNIEAKQQKSFSVELTAAYLGEFNLPAVSVEAMYDNSVNAIVKGGRVVITK
ncbi:MAG: alpha-2-macroglobulin family protein [Bacteroidales bacterium]